MTVKIKNIRLEISFWFAAVLTLLTVLLPGGKAAACYVFCILHELGHLLLISKSGVAVEKISFGYFGVRIETGGAIPSKGREIAVSAAGPAVNAALGTAFLFFGPNWAAVMNFALAAFNLMPVPMLDGGKILSAVFPDRRLLKKIGIAFCAVFVLSGAALAFFYKNFTLLITSLYILTGTFLSPSY